MIHADVDKFLMKHANKTQQKTLFTQPDLPLWEETDSEEQSEEKGRRASMIPTKSLKPIAKYCTEIKQDLFKVGNRVESL